MAIKHKLPYAVFSSTHTHTPLNNTRDHSHLAASAMVRLSPQLLFSSQPLQGVFTRFIACEGGDVALVSGREMHATPPGQMWPSIWNTRTGFGLNPYPYHAEPPICSQFPLPCTRRGARRAFCRRVSGESEWTREVGMERLSLSRFNLSYIRDINMPLCSWHSASCHNV